MAVYKIYNGPSPTTAAQVAVTTGTAIKTLLQVKMRAGIIGRVVEWGISFDGSAAAQPIKVEVIETDVAATVTAHVAAGIVLYDPAALLIGDPTSNIFEVGTSATGYTASAEGTTTASRVLDARFVAPTNERETQYPLGREGVLQPGKFGRIRTTAPAAVNAYCYFLIEV